MSLYLDKTGWKRVAFGDVARNVNRTVKDPPAAGLDRVIAMEHLDPGELKIARWGDVADGTTFTRRVEPGQTLFGKRRAYQRKAAYAEFAAVCSGDILTFEADEDHLLPKFLPFILQSDGFYDHALGTSAGSLSPRTNWRDLANYEFDLPPLDEQQRLADLLWAVERQRQALLAEGDSARMVRHTSIAVTLQSPSTLTIPLGDLIRHDTTITYGIVQAGPDVDDGVPYIRVSDMTDGHLSIEDMKRTAPEIAARFGRSRVDTGDLVVALRGRTGLTLKVPEGLDGANLTQGTARVAVDETRVSADYVAAVMNSSWMTREINRRAKGSTFAELTLAALRALPIPRLGLQPEDDFLRSLVGIDAALAAIDREHAALGAFRSALLADIFGGAA